MVAQRRWARAAAALLAITVAALPAACSDDDEAPPFSLDHSARVPDAAGIVASGDRKAIVFTDGRRFPVHAGLITFSVQDVDASKPVPIAAFRGSFAQLGLDDGKAVWAASFGPPLPDDAGAETVYFTGRLRKVEADAVEFQKGIVVPLDDGVTTAAGAGDFVRAKIDPRSGRARALDQP